MSLIKLDKISKVYGFGEAATMALDQIDLEIEKGDFVAIMGASGSGKSTLMNIIGMLDRQTTGRYDFDKQDVSFLSNKKRALIRRQKMGFVFQSFNLLPRLNALDNVALPLTYSGKSYVERLEKAADMLTKLGLGKRQYYMPNQLSGGQIQRVAIARALVNKPQLILADEPTGNLDSKASENLMKVIADINKEGNTIVMVTHDKALAKHAHRIITIKDGRISSDRKTGKRKTKKRKRKVKK